MKKDVFLGLIGNVLSFISNFLLVPLYINYLGTSGYGVISLISTITAFCVIFDSGLGVSIAREVALYKNKGEAMSQIPKFMLSVEVIYLASSISIALLIIFFSDYLAHNWLESEELTSEYMGKSLRVIGLIILFKWPIGLYQNLLLGLGQIVKMNQLKIIFSVIYILLTYLMLKCWNFDLIWTLFGLVGLHIFGLCLFSVVAWQDFRQHRSFPKIDFDILANLKKLVLGFSVFSIIGVLFMNIDKIFLSKYFSIETYGIYMIIITLGLALMQVIYPVTSALFKDYSFYAANKQLYIADYRVKVILQSASVFIVSFVIIIISFHEVIIEIWTGQSNINKSILLSATPFYIGIVFYALHNILLIPLIVKARIKYLNKAYAITLLIQIVLYLLIIPVTQSLYYMTSIFLVASFILFCLTLGAYLVVDGINTKLIMRILRFLYTEFGVIFFLFVGNLWMVQYVKNAYTIDSLNIYYKLIYMATIFVSVAFVQTMGSRLLRKELVKILMTGTRS